jgi:hypothetical protein
MTYSALDLGLFLASDGCTHMKNIYYYAMSISGVADLDIYE